MPESVESRVITWLVHGRPGRSSLTILIVALPVLPELPAKYLDLDAPYDYADLARCLDFLAAVPELRERLPKVAAKVPAFAGFAAEWGQWEKVHAAFRKALNAQDAALEAARLRWQAVAEEFKPFLPAGGGRAEVPEDLWARRRAAQTESAIYNNRVQAWDEAFKALVDPLVSRARENASPGTDFGPLMAFLAAGAARDWAAAPQAGETMLVEFAEEPAGRDRA